MPRPPRAFARPALSYSVGQVATVLNVSPSTVRRMADAGRLRSSRVGRDRRISARSLADYLAEHGGNVSPAEVIPTIELP
jgi:excisionase family DNA binding protein